MRSQGTVRQWDGMDKRDQAYPRPRTGWMSHGNPRYNGTMGRPRTSYGKVEQPSELSRKLRGKILFAYRTRTGGCGVTLIQTNIIFRTALS